MKKVLSWHSVGGVNTTLFTTHSQRLRTPTRARTFLHAVTHFFCAAQGLPDLRLGVKLNSVCQKRRHL